MRKIAVLAGLLVMPFAAQANLIFNGDFELGNTGFTTSYGYVQGTGTSLFGAPPITPASGAGQGMYDESRYTITNVQPGAWHSAWRNDIVDLTPASQGGHGYYMLLNGATTGPSTAWNQSVAGLVDGTTYYFSFDLFTAYGLDNALASLQLNLGTVNLGSVIAPTGTQQWQQLFVSFVYDSSTMGNGAGILNLTNQATGNDFGIDNIVLSTNPVPEPFTMALGALGIGAFIRKRRTSKA